MNVIWRCIPLHTARFQDPPPVFRQSPLPVFSVYLPFEPPPPIFSLRRPSSPCNSHSLLPPSISFTSACHFPPATTHFSSLPPVFVDGRTRMWVWAEILNVLKWFWKCTVECDSGTVPHLRDARVFRGGKERNWNVELTAERWEIIELSIRRCHHD